MAESSLNNFVLALAGVGGVIIILFVVGICAYFIVYVRIPIVNVTFVLLWIGMLISVICTSVDMAESREDVKRAVIIVHTVVNSLLIILLGFSAYHYIKNDPSDRTMYMMTVIPVSLLLSVIGLSATTMQKLSSKPVA